jgi:hypothetical protein
MAAAFIMGMGQGYNNDYTSTNVFGETSAESYFCSVAGRVIGTCISVGPKALANAGTAIVKKGLTSAGVAIAEKSVTKIGQDVTKTAVAATASKTAKAAEQSILQKEAKYTLDQLADAGKVLDRGGLTKASRGLEKHGNRTGSVFPKPTGNVASKNAQGQFQLEDILTSPGNKSFPNRLGGIDIHAPDGRGARYDSLFEFIGFLEKRGPKP